MTTTGPNRPEGEGVAADRLLSRPPVSKRTALIAAAVVLLVLLTAFGYDRFVRDDSPTSDERVACGALRDVYAALRAEDDLDHVEDDVRRYSRAANRSVNDALAEVASRARVSMGAYAAFVNDHHGEAGPDRLWDPFVRQLRLARRVCEEDLAIPI